MDIKYKTYWRKTGLKGDWGNVFLNLVAKHKPKNFLEIGVFCGVTSINICNLLDRLNKGRFTYTGVDLFGGEKKSEIDELEPKFLKNQKFSNPLKNIYYNLILRENLNSIKSVKNLLKKYEENVNLIQEIEYRPNRLVFFVNTLHSLHGVSQKNISPHYRKYINIIGEFNFELFNFRNYLEN